MGLSRKRLKQIKKIAFNRRNSPPVVTPALRCTRIKHKIKKLNYDLRDIVRRKELPFKCRHYFIGSSCFLRFLKNQFTLRTAHGCLRSRLNQKVGSIGEQAFAKTCEPYLYQPFTISSKLPFLVATPDFILLKRRPELIEVKTSKSIEGCEQMFRSPNNDFLIQIWIAMELFGLDKAQLLIYHYEESAETSEQIRLF
jgi:hypothetical protein